MNPSSKKDNPPLLARVEEKEQAQHLGNMLYTDLLMLQEGDWVPDRHSVQDTLDNLEQLLALYDITPMEVRD